MMISPRLVNVKIVIESTPAEKKSGEGHTKERN
jgi:hypothetical protein